MEDTLPSDTVLILTRNEPLNIDIVPVFWRHGPEFPLSRERREPTLRADKAG